MSPPLSPSLAPDHDRPRDAAAFLDALKRAAAPGWDVRIVPHGAQRVPGGWARLTLEVRPAENPRRSASPSAADVRNALRVFDQPLALAGTPLARGTTPDERVAAARQTVLTAVDRAFGASPRERQLRRVLELGYLRPVGGHEAAAGALGLTRATYFRRLRTASDRVAAAVVAAGDHA